MQAPASDNSTIKVHFGDKGHKSAASPLHLSLALDFFSQEQKSIRAKLESSLNTTVPSTAIVFELVVSSNSQQIAERLNNSEIVKDINENTPSQITYHGFENKLYIIVNSLFEIPEEDFAVVKLQSLDETQQIHLNISSHNDLVRISELLKQKGPIGLLDSLEVDFEFAKTKLTETVIITILEKMGFSGTQIIKSFRKINFEFNGASSSILSQFPKVVFKPIEPKSKNEISSILGDANITEAHLYLLNKTLYLRGKFEVNGLAALLSALYI